MLAQLGGIWYGELHNDSTHKKQNFEIGLSEYRGKITGFTYTTFIENDTFYYSIKKVKAVKKDGLLIITDDEMVGNNFPEKAAKHVKQTTVFPLINDSTFDITKGSWSTNQTKIYYSLKGSAEVKEQDDRGQSDLIAHLEEMKVKTDITVKKPQKKIENPVVKTTPPVNKPGEKKTDVVKEQSSTVVQTIKTKPEIRTTTQPENKLPVADNPVTTNKPVASDPVVAKQNIPIQKPIVQKTEPALINNSTDATKPIMNAPLNVQQKNTNQSPVVQKTELALADDNKMETQKVNDITPAQKNDLVVKPLPPVVATRKSETIQSLYFHSDSLVLSLYDNGVVDGDTVSVFLNGNPIISKQLLKVSAFKKTIYITPDMDSVELVLFADNLGSIPPNTGLLTVRDGDQTFNVRFSADLQKNAAILLSRKK